MTDRDALLRAICEHPDEDTPRLVFADYLEENDEAARAAFIRAQVEVATVQPWEPVAVRAKWHAPKVVTGSEFLGTLPKLETQAVDWAPWPFRRGFGWWLRVRVPVLWDALVEPVFDLQPVGRLSLWAAPLDSWRQVAASPFLRRVRAVEFMLSPIEPLLALRDAPGVEGIRDLHFERSSGAGMPEVVEDLFRSRLGAAVRGLHFRIGYESRDALLDALNTGPPLDRLSFAVVGVGPDAARRLFDGPVASELTELHLRDEPLGGDGLRVLAEVLPPTLRDLTLTSIGVRADGLEVFVRSDRLANLCRLDLSKNPLTPRAVKVLSLSHGLPSLRSLDLSGCNIGDKGVRHLTLAKWWPGLVEVNLRNNAISAAGVRHLLNAPVPQDLTALVLDREHLGAESRSELVQKFGPAVVFASGAVVG